MYETTTKNIHIAHILGYLDIHMQVCPHIHQYTYNRYVMTPIPRIYI